ncbi:hypothetical protein THAOC_23866, partial [Thalassiosira oceanica]
MQVGASTTPPDGPRGRSRGRPAGSSTGSPRGEVGPGTPRRPGEGPVEHAVGVAAVAADASGSGLGRLASGGPAAPPP